MNNSIENTEIAANHNQKYYIFYINNSNTIIYQLFCYIIILLNLAGILYIEHNKNPSHFNTSAIIFALFYIALICWDVYKFKKTKHFQSLGILLLIISLRWLQYSLGWIFMINIGLWALYTIAKRRLKITISDSQISYPSFPVKKILWSSVENVILKDDLLTIDLKNNKLYQHYIKNSSALVNEMDFNDFCRKRLMEHHVTKDK